MKTEAGNLVSPVTVFPPMAGSLCVSSDESSDLSLAIVDSAVGKQREGEQREGSLERGEEKGRREGEEGKLIVTKLMKPSMALCLS